jgi:hypothetical protein
MNGFEAPVQPENLASCPCCGCLILAYRDGWSAGPLLLDPSLSDRRLIRSMLTRADVERQGFGCTFLGHHECPPEELCRLKPYDRPGRVLAAPADLRGDGAVLRPYGPPRPSDPSDPEPGARP